MLTLTTPDAPHARPSLADTLRAAQLALPPEHAVNLAAIQCLLPLVLSAEAIVVRAPLAAPVIAGPAAQNWRAQ